MWHVKILKFGERFLRKTHFIIFSLRQRGYEWGITVEYSIMSKTWKFSFIHNVIVTVWWDFKGILFFELLPRNETIDLNVYCRQLENLNQSIAQKRPELVNRKRVVFYHDNARPHTSYDSPKFIGAWMGRPSASPIFSRLSTIRF